MKTLHLFKKQESSSIPGTGETAGDRTEKIPTPLTCITVGQGGAGRNRQ